MCCFFGYTDIAIEFFPLGRLILAASIINAFEEDHATSLEFSILNFQVNLSSICGRELGLFISSSDLIMTVSSLNLAFQTFQVEFLCILFRI